MSQQSPTAVQYGSTNQPPPHNGTPTNGTLPFTGFEVGLLIIVAIVLCLLGLVLGMFRNAD